MKATVIHNARSGKGRAPMIEAISAKVGPELGWEIECCAIERMGHGAELAREAVARGVDRVICVGGDGTLNAVGSAMIGSKTPTGLVAMGSGNGYARSLGLPLQPEAALRRALTGTPKLMDVCYLNDMPFIGTAGIGFDARVAHRFDKSKGRGMIGYAKIIVQEIFSAPPMRVVVKANHETTEANVLMLVLCNTREFGNGAKISPGSLPDDGLAELRVVTKPPFLSLIKAFVQIYTNKADNSPYIRNIVTTNATIWQAGTVAHLDGEPHEVGNEVRFRLEQKKLLMVV
ncbi:MAG TPA: diacylglycerol kinase family protein [Flavobacteriales bacterium]|nr:diacylglycerol kinase family protein [Flavobacteriales bacterium]